MRSTKDQLVKKRRSYACETQCFPVEPSGCRRGAFTGWRNYSPLVSMKKEKKEEVPLRTAYSQDSRIDEAHFWLNGYVNKQNCGIWSEANPQVYVETPLHPEKLTLWCALWAGGILLQKR
ncbi:hypothetical protein TNCV_1987001 [Trichonephila clavipes]|nr:hypothetical protein TNCV_1987001 [Trichonephila clavipes]